MPRQVTLVCGPPCAGKSSWVADRAASEDVVVDYDAIATELGSPSSHDHPEEVRAVVRAERSSREAAIASMVDGTAYVIRSSGGPAARARVAAALGATDVVVLDPGRDVVESRAQHRPAWTGGAIDRWYAQNQPDTGEPLRQGGTTMPDDPTPTEPPTPPAAPAKPAEPSTAGSDKGYPDGTPLEQMTAPQQAAYWRAQSRKHEDRVKAYDGLTADDLKSLRDKATRHDALERELMSDKDKGIAEARAEEAAKAVPRVVRAEFKAAAKDVLTADQLNALLEDRDLSKYANAKGEPDETKIENLVKAFAPAKTSTRTGPSATGLGSHQPSGGAGDQGRAMAAKRFGTKTA